MMDCMMDYTHNKLPARARPAALARHRTRLTGHLTAGELPRIAELCRSPAARVSAALVFAFEDASGRIVMQIHVRAELQLTCQRCLSAMAWRTDHRNRLVIVGGHEEAKRLPRGADHIVCMSEDLAPADVVEEELLLLLPQIPVHESIGQCDPGMVAHLRGDGARHARGGPRNSPFAALENIRL